MTNWAHSSDRPPTSNHAANSAVPGSAWQAESLLQVVVGGVSAHQLVLAPGLQFDYAVLGNQLVHALGGLGFGLLVAGGLAYSLGALVYARKRPNPVDGVFGYHEVFHACTIVGAVLHYVVIAVFVLPLAH